MTIRLWLLVADCWRCGCSVELTAEQEAQIRSLLADSDEVSSRPGASSHSASASTHLAKNRTSPPQSAPTRSKTQPRWERLSARHRLVPTPAAQTVPLQLPVPQSQSKRLRDWLSQMPAWLISLLFHMALLAALALLFFENESRLEDFYITLSTEANRMRWVGGETRFTNPEDRVKFDMPIPDPKSQTRDQRAALVRANQEAKQLRVDPGARLPQLPSLKQVKQTLKTGTASQRTFAARDPRVRGEIVTREGGTTLTEAAVARGLRWLAKHQHPDGSWSLHRFHKTCRGKCNGRGRIECDSAATSLALLPFLGAGQTHQTGIYKETVSKGLRWLIEHQLDDGDLRAGCTSDPGMYAHGQGAIVLCEAFALTRDEELRMAAQKAIDFIVVAQHSAGGWRYHPGQPGDTSVLGWQLMAMQSARSAELKVPIETWELANLYLDSVESYDGSRYAYQPGRHPTHVMTAEALLCRMYLGWTTDYAALEQGVRWLLRRHMPRDDGTDYYYWYYATQVMHHYGGSRWKAWNMSMRDVLVERQVKDGHEVGSWDPRGERRDYAAKGGRIYTTSLAICTLEVYYRHAPIFRQLNLD